MKVLISTDSFKHSLSATDVAVYLRKGLLSAAPSWEIQCQPMADGGEGTVEVIIATLGGNIIRKEVAGPLMDPVEASYGILPGGETAIIEMSAASGLELLKEEEADPWITTTYGTGELVKDALDRNCTKIIIGLGGSATNDGGTGFARALGVKFLDEEGGEVNHGGGYLGKIKTIDTRGLDPRIKGCEIIAATDVTNILTGEHGASMVYAQQKGANRLMAEKLDRFMSRYASTIHQSLGKDISSIPGSGAAGGLAAGLIAFCDATIRPGFEVIAGITGLKSRIAECDVVITGEGRLDGQTLHGKVPMGVARMAKEHGKKLITVAGTLGKDYEKLYEEGFDVILSIITRPISLEDALKDAPTLLENCGRNIAGILKLCKE